MLAMAMTIEAGPPDRVRPALIGAGLAIFGPARTDWPESSFTRFHKLVFAEAYESAAFMLLPEGWVIAQMAWWPCSESATVHMDNQAGLKACSGAKALPIALAAASIRAAAAVIGGQDNR